MKIKLDCNSKWHTIIIGSCELNVLMTVVKSRQKSTKNRFFVFREISLYSSHVLSPGGIKTVICSEY